MTKRNPRALTILALSGFIALTGCRSKDDEPATVSDYAFDGDSDGYDSTQDCDDSNPEINPLAPELCDGLDNDCDGDVDEGLANCDEGSDTGDTGDDDLIDADGDGFNSDDDCDDSNATVYPEAPELCDGVDNDCDVEVDEGLAFVDYYEDSDGDGFGDDGTLFSSCEELSGYATIGGDCDDTPETGAGINPGVPEDCGNEIDDNCDGDVDEMWVSMSFEISGLGTDGDYCSHPDDGSRITSNGVVTLAERNACEQSADSAYTACYHNARVVIDQVTDGYVEQTCYTTIVEQTDEADAQDWTDNGRCMWLYPADYALEIEWTHGGGNTWDWETNAPVE